MTLKEKLEAIQNLAQFLFKELEEVEQEANKQEEAIIKAYGVTSVSYIDDTDTYWAAVGLGDVAYYAEAAKDEAKDLFDPINKALKKVAQL